MDILRSALIRMSPLQGCALITGVCPHYRGVFSLQVCVFTTGMSSLQGCVLTTGVCPHYRGVSSLQRGVLTTGVCPHCGNMSSVQFYYLEALQ